MTDADQIQDHARHADSGVREDRIFRHGDSPEHPAGLTREFETHTLDVDDLAHAIRCLLSEEPDPRRPAPDVAAIDLPSYRVRGRNVSEASDTL